MKVNKNEMNKGSFYLYRLLFSFFTVITTSLSFAAGMKLPAEEKFSPLLWNFENHGQPYRIDQETFGLPGTPGADIKLLQAWTFLSQAPDLKIAVIDGQFDLEHEDLKNIFDVGLSWDFLENQGPVKAPIEDLSPHHGTLVAGVIGADGTNSFGITGILRKSRIIPIEAIPIHGHEDDNDVAQAIYYAVAKGAKIINCSFGKYTTSKVVEEAIVWAQKNDVLIITSAGNEGVNVDEQPHWPSSYSTIFDNVISVAASNRSDRLVVNSNYGKGVDIAAPGHEIFTTGNPLKAITKYSSFNGTSAAAPHVTGVAGLMLALNPKLTPGEIKKLLLQTADPLPSNHNGFSIGRLNAFRALQLVSKKMKSSFFTAEKDCDYTLNRKEYLKTKSRIGNRWDLFDRPELYEPWQGKDEQLNAYRDWVSSHNTGDFRSILQKHLDAGRKILARLDPHEELAKSILEEEKFILSIMNGSVGKVQPLSCIESIVFRDFLKSNNNLKSKKEFISNIFQKEGKIVVLAEWALGPDNDADFTGAIESEKLKSERAKMLAAGWRLLADYHNHPFNFENKWGDIGGGLAPSDQDLATYGSLKPAYGVITNGIDTIRIESAF